MFQVMGSEVDQFNRAGQYPGVYPTGGDSCFSNQPSETIDISALQQREWEMRVYNQMHGNSTPTEADYIFAARKVQVDQSTSFYSVRINTKVSPPEASDGAGQT